MNSGTVYIAGAGLSGLSAAVALAAKGIRVEVFEATGAAGGRCRSYYDSAVDQIIDNGNHLILSGNRSVHDYLRMIGSAENFSGPAHTDLAFAELPTAKRWTIHANDGPLPWWIFDEKRRVPGTSAVDYLAFARLMRPGLGRIPDGPLWHRLVRPLLLAALNTEPETASPALIATILRETIAKGGKAWRPRVASPTLAAAFIDPAVAFVEQRGGTFRFGQRLRNLVLRDSTVRELQLTDATLPLSAEDSVILALPPWAAASLLPGLTAPDEFRAILSAHFRIAPRAGVAPITGVIGGIAEWIFAFPDRISVTISNADRLMDGNREELAVQCWKDVAAVYGLPDALPPWQIVKERRATFAATPEQEAKRPGAKTQWANLYLAGDWTDTGLPATIESAVRSGRRAADLALSHGHV
jgi:squalene-associated FAD-dependent desaturase